LLQDFCLEPRFEGSGFFTTHQAFRMSTVAIRSAALPAPIPVTVRRFRQPKKTLPQTKIERDHVLNTIRDYVAEHKLVPPTPLDELARSCGEDRRRQRVQSRVDRTTSACCWPMKAGASAGHRAL